MASSMIQNGLLFDKRRREMLAPVGSIHEDWTHIYLCKGIGGQEIWLIVDRLKALGYGSDVFEDELKTYIWPRRIRDSAVTPHQVFSKKRAASNERADGWKSSASEFLMVAPVLNAWMMIHAADALPAECEAFHKLSQVIDR